MATNVDAAAVTAAWILDRCQAEGLNQKALHWATGIEQSRLSDLMNAKANVTELEGERLRHALGADTYPWAALREVAERTYAGGAKGPYLELVSEVSA